MKVTATVKLEEGITVTCSAHVTTENYGADADGNRGIMQTMVEEVEAWLGDYEIYELLQQSYTDKIDQELADAYEEAQHFHEPDHL